MFEVARPARRVPAMLLFAAVLLLLPAATPANARDRPCCEQQRSQRGPCVKQATRGASVAGSRRADRRACRRARARRALATVVARSAGLESRAFEEFDQASRTTGTLATDEQRAYEGAVSARATYSGGGANGYARGVWSVSWQEGDEVWYSAAFFLPSGFKAAMQGQVDLLRWDDWPSHRSDTEWGGLVIFGSDKRLRLRRFNAAGTADTTLVGPIDLPEGRWVHLEVHQRLSRQAPLSELFVDGQLAGRSTAVNTSGRPIERLRVGLVAIASGRQVNPLTLWFDRAAFGGVPSGPAGVPAPPPPDPTPPTPTPPPDPTPPPPPPPPAPEPTPEPAPAPPPTTTPPSYADWRLYLPVYTPP